MMMNGKFGKDETEYGGPYLFTILKISVTNVGSLNRIQPSDGKYSHIWPAILGESSSNNKILSSILCFAENV